MATPAPRRSRRIAASRDGSRAGSVVSDDAASTAAAPGLYHRPSTQESTQEQEQDTFAAATSLSARRTPAKITKTPSKKQARTHTSTLARTKNCTFDAAAAIDCIMRDRTHIKTLTNMQKDAVISAFAVREDGLRDQLATQRSQLTSQESQIEELTRERDEAKRKYEQKRTLRESIFYERVQKQSQESRQSQQQTSAIPASAMADSDALVLRATPAPLNEPKEQSNEPETSKALVVATPRESALETPRSSFFGRIFKTITSPFSTRRPSDSLSPQASQERKPLGELPSSRKRPAPEPEHPVEPEAMSEEQAARTRPTPQRKTAHPPQPHAQTPYQPATLDPISEKAEPEQRPSISMPDPTPSRPPRSVAKLRRATREQQKTPGAKTAGRVWTRQPQPKEPNADARLEKLRRFHEAQRTIDTMKDDEELREMVPRPTKRVKIDDLVFIPHNRPGDSESTFRVYDVDSDDEMEVDAETAEIRQNIFEVSKTNDEDDKEEEAPKQVQVTQVAPKVNEPRVEIPRMTFDFPNVGLMPEDQRDRPIDEYLGAKFAYGFAEWQRSGTLVIQW